MKKKLIIISAFTLNENDFDRFFVNTLKKDFDITFLDCSRLFHIEEKNHFFFRKDYFLVRDFYHLKELLQNFKADAALDLLGFNFLLKTSAIRFLINFKYSVFYWISGPKLRVSAQKRYNDFFLILKNFLFKKIFEKLIFFNTTFILSGKYRSSYYERLSKKKPIFFVSSDYKKIIDEDKVIKKNKIIKNKYAIFLEEAIPDHPEYDLILRKTRKRPIEVKEYYLLINKFFYDFEKKFNLKVIIAAHPRSKKTYLKKHLPNFKILQYMTLDLVKNSEVVIAHNSTSISYAIYFKKKIIFLSSNKIKNSWLGKEIDSYQNLLSGSYVNLDKYDINKIDLYNYSNFKYRNYIHNFLAHPLSKKKINLSSEIHNRL